LDEFVVVVLINQAPHGVPAAIIELVGPLLHSFRRGGGRKSRKGYGDISGPEHRPTGAGYPSLAVGRHENPDYKAEEQKAPKFFMQHARLLVDKG
jgi:hypothetical protein